MIREAALKIDFIVAFHLDRVDVEFCFCSQSLLLPQRRLGLKHNPAHPWWVISSQLQCTLSLELYATHCPCAQSVHPLAFTLCSHGFSLRLHRFVCEGAYIHVCTYEKARYHPQATSLGMSDTHFELTRSLVHVPNI